MQETTDYRMESVIVIGGGAAGLACAAHLEGALVLERLPQAGRKILVTGGGRCNFTHEGSPEALAAACTTTAANRFTRAAFHTFPPTAQVRWFEELGVSARLEAGGHWFPASQQAASIREALLRAVGARGGRIRTGVRVARLLLREGAVCGVETASGERIEARHVVLAAGGAARPGLGTDGDAARLAAAAGLDTHPAIPALGALYPDWDAAFETLSGVTLPDAEITVSSAAGKRSARGGLLFTGRGLSGPAALNVCADFASGLSRADAGEAQPQGRIAWRADQNRAEDWMAILEREARAGQGRRLVRTTLSAWLPASLAAVLCRVAGMPEDCVHAQAPREPMRRLCALCAAWPLRVLRTDGLDKAMVSRGGIVLSQVKPTTLECRYIRGLYVIGEALDVDAICGGYNLAWAWASGATAARAIRAEAPDGGA